MIFSSNPLSLSIPDPALESWLRDSGYLEIIDQYPAIDTVPAPVPWIASGLFNALYSYSIIFISFFTINPFSMLTASDFTGPTPPWSLSFLADYGSYSFPAGSVQTKLRIHENIKRYARNYACLFVLFFACALYQMPLALVGFASSLAIWDIFKLCSGRWGWDRYPMVRLILVRIVQCTAAVILLGLNVQLAVFCSLGIGYAVMIVHAACRKLAPVKAALPPQAR